MGDRLSRRTYRRSINNEGVNGKSNQKIVGRGILVLILGKAFCTRSIAQRSANLGSNAFIAASLSASVY